MLIVLAALSFAMLDAATKYATQLAPVLMLLWFRYAFQAVVTFALRALDGARFAPLQLAGAALVVIALVANSLHMRWQQRA